MNTVIYNLDYLISINVTDRRVNKDYEYRESVPSRRYNLFFKTKEQPAGYYFHQPFYEDKLCTVEEIRAKGFLVDEDSRKVYHMPRARLQFKDQVSFTQKDADYNVVLAWAKNIAKGLVTVELEYE